MSSIVISGDTSGAITVAAPAVSGTNTLTLQAATATSAINTLGTVNAGGTNPFPSSGGPTVVDFTGLPSWIKRITVIFSGVSTTGSSNYLIQIGDSGGIENTGYNSTAITDGASSGVLTAGFAVVYANSAAALQSGRIEINLITGTSWVASGNVANNTGNVSMMGGNKTLSDTLTQVRITTVGGTETFDAGTINILYEG